MTQVTEQEMSVIRAKAQRAANTVPPDDDDGDPDSSCAQVNQPELDAEQALKVIDTAIESLRDGDDGAHWEPGVIETARYIFQTDKALFQRKRSELKKSSSNAQITDWTKEIRRGRNEVEDTTKSGEIVELVQGCSTLFHDPHGECFVSFEQGDHLETWGIASKGFSDWLSYKAYRELDFVPSDAAMKSSLVTLRGIATHDGDEVEVFLRCAPWQNGYMIDLANDKWQAIEILPTGWRIIDKPQIKFIRSQTATSLPIPASCGDLNLWWLYLNISIADRTLILVDALDSWRPDTPYTVLDILGEHGSGKSSTHSCYRQATDPNSIPLRAAPKSVDDLFVSAGANHQASYENMSNMSAAMQDGLCTLATGGGYGKRKLYSDSEETTIEIKRKVVINGISDVVTRPDLIDRTVRIELPKLDRVTDEREFNAAFERDRPAIFRGLLDLFVQALSILPTISLKGETRMIGFAKLGEAVHQSLGIEQCFLQLYQANKNESLARSIESSPAAAAVQDLMRSRGNETWEGNLKDLKKKLERHHRQDGEGWPKSPKGLGSILRRMAPALRSVGVDVSSIGRHMDGYHVRICSVQVFSESESNVHKVHKFMDSNESDRKTANPEAENEHMNLMNIETRKKKKADRDVPDDQPLVRTI